MDFLSLLHAFILGLVQGLTEFLPVSSSAHLTVVPWIFSWPETPLVFDTSLHLGTAIALLAFFWHDFLTMARSLLAPKTFATPREATNWRRLTLGIVLGMLPAGIIGLIFDKQIEALFSGDMLRTTIYIVIAALVLVGAFLLYLDKTPRTLTKEVLTITWKDALVVGLFQVFALIPGVSRSGSTIAGGLVMGLSKADAARFAFLLGTPMTMAAGLYKLKDLGTIVWSQQLIFFFIVGVLTSTISGYLVIKFFLNFLNKHGLAPFMYYRFALAAFLLIMTFVR
ncbi:undecaprenyl-diphosphatase UppP [Candidatus Gracilibacteria bacterium CG17_big_fil_post_rev_8_21_14_2_50_48_13]|nr:MAG: undecaprenyl-diphosphatase UppP [Candidatus Gracilibacteria bacterium CG17_big_fil_post_rev_8_21_14_2_50_48_13]